MLVRYVEGTRTRLSDGLELFCNTLTGKAVIVSGDVMYAASLCTEFATTRVHAQRIGSIRPRGTSKTWQMWELDIVEALQRGVLLSAEEIEPRIRYAHGQEDRSVIDIVGIPTKDRPELLNRALSSLVQNLRQAARTPPRVLIVDDSASPSIQALNKEIATRIGLEGNVRIGYADRASRALLAKDLAVEASVPVEIATFAILSAPEYSFGAGACRNAILLDAAEHCFMYLDDDIECRISGIPDSTDTVCFGLQKDCKSTWFLEEWTEVEEMYFTGEDLIGLHERVLNVDCELPQHLRGTSAALVSRLINGDWRVVISLAGTVGDVAFDSPLPYLRQGRDTLARLFASATQYRSAMTNRLVISGSRQLIVNDFLSCMSGCLGVDNRETMPPFMPVQRCEDSVFGLLVNKCVPGALFAQMPRAIVHRPVPFRRFEPDAMLRSAGRRSTGEALNALIGAERVYGTSRALRLETLGRRLADLDRLKGQEFSEYIRWVTQPAMTSAIENIHKIMKEVPAQTSAVVGELKQLETAYIAAWNSRDPFVPRDLASVFGVEEGSRRFRDLVQRFAALLEVWPTLVRASKRLHDRGVEVGTDLQLQMSRPNL